MLVAGRRIEGIGLGTAQFAFRNGTAEDSAATVRAALDADALNLLASWNALGPASPAPAAGNG